MPNVWAAIADGSILRKTIKELSQSQEIVTPERYQLLRKAESYEEKIRIGQEIEQAIRKKFEIELLDNAHGGLYSSLSFNPLGLLHLGIERFSFANTEVFGEKVHCGKCGKYVKNEKFSPGFVCPQKEKSN